MAYWTRLLNNLLVYRRKKGKRKQNTKITQKKAHTTLLFISHDQLVCHESRCGHKIEEVTPKQTRYEHVRRKQ